MSDHNPIYVLTKSVADELSDEELAAIYLAAQGGGDPALANGYEKASGLFNEHGQMNGATLDAFDSIVEERLKR